ncbi:MAG: PAS domain-containing protein, partial [Telmatospirillum sp.]|nr:PAS domain-containing protein [Telmatospirillum sp.]
MTFGVSLFAILAAVPLGLLIGGGLPGQPMAWLGMLTGLATASAGLLSIRRSMAAGGTETAAVTLGRLAFEKSADPILICDSRGAVTGCNDALVKVLGARDAAQLLGSPVSAFSPDRQPDGSLSSTAAEQATKRALTDGVCRFEALRRRCDGTSILVDVTLVPIEVEGRRQLISYWKDLAELARTREARRQLADRFEADVTGTVTGFSQAAEAMQGVISRLSALFQQTRR